MRKLILSLFVFLLVFVISCEKIENPYQPSRPFLFSVAPTGGVAGILFFDDMESGSSNWTHSGNFDKWELGTPSTVGPSSAYSGTKCWGTWIDANYSNDAQEILTSREIYIPDTTSDITLSFYHWYDTESWCDEGDVLLVYNGGSSSWWLDWFEGSKTNWSEQTYYIPSFLKGETIQIRFIFWSDGSVMEPGWYIDDIKIEILP